jgi:hypothetical protein
MRITGSFRPTTLDLPVCWNVYGRTTRTARVEMPMQVTLLYVDGCPNWQIAETRLRAALDELGHPEVPVTRRLVAADVEADALGFGGSPSIMVDGRDLFGEVNSPVGLSCRMYRSGEGIAGAPTLDQLIEALA